MRNPGAIKRQKELARKQRQAEKVAKREQRKRDKLENPDAPDDLDGSELNEGEGDGMDDGESPPEVVDSPAASAPASELAGEVLKA